MQERNRLDPNDPLRLGKYPFFYGTPEGAGALLIATLWPFIKKLGIGFIALARRVEKKLMRLGK